MSTLQPKSPKMTETKMTSIGDVLANLFTDTAPCQMCGKRVPTYHDREKDSHYCLTCLEAAVEEAEAEMTAEWLATPLEDGPEDPEVVAMGRAVLDELFPLSASQAEIRAERQDMALLACHSRQIAA